MIHPCQPGDVLLGKYQVERVLGQGGMGVVVAARHIDLGELFAIKFLLPAAVAQPDAVERFLREARASARLKGEHVVRVLDVGRLPDGLPYMVMEHLSGSDLKDLVQTQGPLPVADAIHYVLQACEALSEAHALGIVHRDLKPANMFLIRRPNGAPCVKVLDFGISKQIEPEQAEQHALTRTGQVLGSPIYMSPEQMMRTKEADPRSDIWSMGVVLYQLLTGTVPFLADVLTELVGKVLQEEPLPPSHHRREIPPAIDAVVLTCLQKRKEHRYQTVDQLTAALRTALSAGGAPAMALGPAAESAGGTVALPGTGATTSGHGAGAVSAGVTGPGAHTQKAWGTTDNPGAPQTSTRRGALLVAAGVTLLVLIASGSLAAWRIRGGMGSLAAPPDNGTSASAPPLVSVAATPILSTAPPPTIEPTPKPTTSGLPDAPSAPPVKKPAGAPVAKATTTPNAKPTAPITAGPAGSSKSTATTASTGALLGRD